MKRDLEDKYDIISKVDDKFDRKDYKVNRKYYTNGGDEITKEMYWLVDRTWFALGVVKRTLRKHD